VLFWDANRQRHRVEAGLKTRLEGVLTRGEFILGPEVSELEDKLGVICSAPHVVTCASGSDALLLALLGSGIGPGDAVFVPTFTFVATAGAVVRTGAQPVFVDVEAGSFCIGKESLTSAMACLEAEDPERRLRPAAVVAVDLFGVPCDYSALLEITEPRRMRLIADAAQSLGASRNGETVGSLASVTATSFFPTKPLGCYGDGGAALCADAGVAAKMRELRNHGRREGSVTSLGWNSRLDTLQAAVLLEKLGIFDEERERRGSIANFYGETLSELVDVPRHEAGVENAWAQYTIVLRGPSWQFPQRRNDVVQRLKEQGVVSRIYYEHPVHRQPAFSKWSPARGSLKLAEELSDRVISLPIHPYLSQAEQSLVVRALEKALAYSTSQK
jgi:dTDP-4-amino-4,6-dideoxygalactose transaminase